MSIEFEPCCTMTAQQANQYFLDICRSYFDPDESKGNVYFTRQSRITKHVNPLVVITTGNVRRDRCATEHNFDGAYVGSRGESISYTVDLFTDGVPVFDETGEFWRHANTAVNDLTLFMDYLDSFHCLDILNTINATVLAETDAQDLTGIVADSNYEFRARAEFRFYFTAPAIGQAGIASSDSIVWPTEDGKPPVEKESVSAGKSEADKLADKATVEPKFEANSSCKDKATIEELTKIAKEEVGYFTEAEITNEDDKSKITGGAS